MKSHKLALKLYATPGTVPPAEKFLETFHGWVKQGTTGELLIDVVDYGHVHQGPSVLCVGHASDYALDLAEGRAGLGYQRKRVPAADAGTHLPDGLGRLLRAAVLLQAELPGLTFDTSEILVKVLDRLNAPNDDATFASEQGELQAVASRMFGEGATVSRDGTDPREPFTVRLKAAKAPTLQDLASRV